MAEAPKIPRDIEFFFETDKDYRTIPANGAWVGTTTRGDINIEFFVEQLRIPDSVKNKLTEDGRLGDEISRKPEKRIVRKVQTGVLISVEAAESLANLLNQKVADIKKMKETKT